MNDFENLNFDDLDSIMIPETPTSQSTSSSTSTYTPTETDDTYKGKQFVVMNKYNIGTLLVRPILDTDGILIDGRRVPRFYRLINNVLIAKVKKPDAKYFSTFTVPDINDFLSNGITLSNEQISQLKRIRDTLFAYRDIAPTWGRPHSPIPGVDNIIQSIEYKKEVTLMLGKLLAQIKNGQPLPSDHPELGHVRIFRFDKGALGVSTFKSVMDSVINMKDMIFNSKTWRGKFFSRELGPQNAVLAIRLGMTTGAKQSYSLNIDFNEMGPSYEITEEDLELGKGLNHVFCDVSHYNTDYFNELESILSCVQSCIDNSLPSGA